MLPIGDFEQAYSDARLEEMQETLDRGLTLPGTTAFHLYETYGLPLDFMSSCRDAGIAFD